MLALQEGRRESSMCDPFCKHPAFLARAIITLLYSPFCKVGQFFKPHVQRKRHSWRVPCPSSGRRRPQSAWPTGRGAAAGAPSPRAAARSWKSPQWQTHPSGTGIIIQSIQCFEKDRISCSDTGWNDKIPAYYWAKLKSERQVW